MSFLGYSLLFIVMQHSLVKCLLQCVHILRWNHYGFAWIETPHHCLYPILQAIFSLVLPICCHFLSIPSVFLFLPTAFTFFVDSLPYRIAFGKIYIFCLAQQYVNLPLPLSPPVPWYYISFCACGHSALPKNSP